MLEVAPRVFPPPRLPILFLASGVGPPLFTLTLRRPAKPSKRKIKKGASLPAPVSPLFCRFPHSTHRKFFFLASCLTEIPSPLAPSLISTLRRA